MDKAKAAVSDFMSKAGKHDTTVHEKVAPAVNHETVNPTRHENVTTAVDKEVHQDHYHHSVQPVQDREVLPEQHSHNLGAVEHRQIEHGNKRDVASRLEQEAAQFRDKRTVADTQETQAVNPTIQGEHVHHHVHETIQPVVHKETIQPNVVHTTVPIHEVHHNAAQHHSTSALPAVSMADFKKQGGVLGGREERYDGFEGEPRAIGGALGGGQGHHGEHHSHHSHNAGGTSGHTAGPHTSGLANKADPRVDSDMDGNRGLGSRNQAGATSNNTYGAGNEIGSTGTTGSNNYGSRDETGTAGTTGSNAMGSRNDTGTSGNTTGAKPSLMQKINPMVDANGDGKPGFMK